MNTIQHHDNWPARAAQTRRVRCPVMICTMSFRVDEDKAERPGQTERLRCPDCGLLFLSGAGDRRAPAVTYLARLDDQPVNVLRALAVAELIDEPKFARQSVSGSSLTGTPPETAPAGASVPAGALVLRKLG